MNSLFKVHELTFALVIRNYDLSLAHAKFLQSSGIVSSDWTLSRQPVANDRLSQTVYSNGINIIGEPNRCLFGETLEDKTPKACVSPEVVRGYISKLSNLDYHALGINFRAYLQLDSLGFESYQDFYNQILVPGSWQQHGTKPVQTELRLVYDFEDSRCSLVINEGKLRQPDSEALPIIVFSGNFAYELKHDTDAERTEKIKDIVTNWQNDLQKFQQIISEFPLEAKEEILIPIEA
ncbi:hypothetical protein [Myxosarcina sp. GI1]|uniref:hypothetical protein n=1 Tax=Myxosarcina sp. GI1 TaxID=1541065 RepID=UPI00056203C4|nr:hypothetical protein [Myxosarcina sp. GI1]